MRSINNEAPAIGRKSITIDADSKKVWAILTDIDNWSSWNKDISHPRLNGDLRPEATFVWRSGGATISSTLHTVEPYSDLGWTGKALGTFAIHNWTLTEANGRTTVSVEESMEGFLVSVFKRSFTKNLETGMRKWLESLKQACEK